MRMLLSAVAAAGFITIAQAPAAYADCVNFSQAAANRAGAALERNAPSAAQLGLPTLEGWRLDGPRTTGDPACNGSAPPTHFYYYTSQTYRQVIEALYPNIRRRTSVDGMGREWFENPVYGSRNEAFLTSGTRLEFSLGADGAVDFILVEPATALAALSTESQPYSIDDIADWTPWPGGAEGPREFVRADGGDAGYHRAATPPSQSSPDQTAQATCPPAGSTANGADQGASAGAAIGGAIFGGGSGRSAGRAVGSVLGGVLGGRNNQQTQTSSTPPCP